MQLRNDLTAEDFTAWLDHPVTELVFAFYNARRFDLMNSWAAGAYAPEENDRAIGQAETYGEMLALQFEQIKEGLEK